MGKPVENIGNPARLAMAGSLITAGQVAEMLGVPTSWVYEQSRRGLIPTVTLGRYRRYRREAIEEWVRRLEEIDRNGGVRRASGVLRGMEAGEAHGPVPKARSRDRG